MLSVCFVQLVAFCTEECFALATASGRWQRVPARKVSRPFGALSTTSNNNNQSFFSTGDIILISRIQYDLECSEDCGNFSLNTDMLPI